jgi:hypothetical protein
MAKIIDMRTRKRWRRNGCYRPQVAARAFKSREAETGIIPCRVGGFEQIGLPAARVLSRLETR